MKLSKISTLTSATILLLTGSLLTGCSDKPEDKNAAAISQSKELVAPVLETTTVETISSGGDSVTTTIDESVAIVPEETNNAIDAGTESVNQTSNTISNTTENIANSAQNMAHDAKDSASSALTEVQDAASTAITNIENAASSVASETKEIASTAVTNTENLVSSAISATNNRMSDATDIVPANPEIIRGIQQGLVNAGFNPGPVDGVSGAKTMNALASFQKQNNLAVGSITKETLQALGVSY